MEIIPTDWTFSRESILPIIRIWGESNNIKAKRFLVGTAVEIIEQSEKFKARLYQEDPKNNQTSLIRISFSLIFPSEEDISLFQEFLSEFSN